MQPRCCLENCSGGDSEGLVRAEHGKFLHTRCLLKPCHVPGSPASLAVRRAAGGWEAGTRRGPVAILASSDGALHLPWSEGWWEHEEGTARFGLCTRMCCSWSCK